MILDLGWFHVKQSCPLTVEQVARGQGGWGRPGPRRKRGPGHVLPGDVGGHPPSEAVTVVPQRFLTEGVPLVG